jgi:Tfp pilus assembly protein PilF
VFRLTISFLALAALMGCVSSGDRTPMDREEVVSRAVELGIAYLRQGDTL